MNTIAVTGATGFVGRAVVAILLERGYRVRVLARPGSAKKLTQHPNLEVIEGDPLKVADVTRLLEGSIALVHLVGIRRAEMKRFGLTYEDVDLGSVLVAIEALKATGVNRVLLLSAADIGDSIYVQTKRKAEAVLRTSNLQWTIFRPSFILGKGQQWPIVLTPFLFLCSLIPGRYGDTAKRAQNITREQLSAAMIWSIEHDQAIGEIFDVQAIRASGNA